MAPRISEAEDEGEENEAEEKEAEEKEADACDDGDRENGRFASSTRLSGWIGGMSSMNTAEGRCLSTATMPRESAEKEASRNVLDTSWNTSFSTGGDARRPAHAGGMM